MAMLSLLTGFALALAAQEPTPLPTGPSIMAGAMEKMASLKTIKGKCLFSVPGKKAMEGEFFFSKPSRFAVTGLPIEIHYDGKTLWQYAPADKTYEQQSPYRLTTIAYLTGYEAFFGLPFDYESEGAEPVTIGKFEAWATQLKNTKQKTKVFVDKASKIILGWTITADDGSQTSLKVTDFQINEAIADAVYTFTPPTDAVSSEARGLTERLLAVGSGIPALKAIDLVERPKPKNLRATLIVFWFADCEACAVALPEIQKKYAQFKDKGLNVLGVNYGDSKAVADKKAAFLKLTYSQIRVKKETVDAFQVPAFPTWYLVDTGGKVLARSVGLDPVTLNNALLSLGMK